MGPKPRDYSFNMPKKVRHLAVRMAISDKTAGGMAKVIDGISSKGGKTKEFSTALKKVLDKSALLVLDSATLSDRRAAANIAKIKLVNSKNVNVFDILKYDWLIFDKSAVSNIEERLKTEK